MGKGELLLIHKALYY